MSLAFAGKKSLSSTYARSESAKSGFLDHSEGNAYFQNLQYVQFWCCREYVLRKISKIVGLKIPVINKSTFDHVKLAVYGLSPQSSDHENNICTKLVSYSGAPRAARSAACGWSPIAKEMRYSKNPQLRT